MRLHKTASKLAVITALAFAFYAAPARKRLAQSSHQRSSRPRRQSSTRARQLRRELRRSAGQSSGFVDLSQDGQSGAGFYPLPQPPTADDCAAASG